MEGAELSVLASIDFETVRFDVLSIVETEPAFRPKGYMELVVNFMLRHGYLFYANVGRNSWFTHRHFARKLFGSSCPG